jgi:hypothetical protein
LPATSLVDKPLGESDSPFRSQRSEAAGVMAAKLRRAGRPVEIRDTLIAGIVAARKATLAARNTKHFEGIDLSLVDPWSAR